MKGGSNVYKLHHMGKASLKKKSFVIKKNFLLVLLVALYNMALLLLWMVAMVCTSCIRWAKQSLKKKIF